MSDCQDTYKFLRALDISEIEQMMQIDNIENNENIENKNTFQLLSWHHNRGRLRYPSSMCRRPRGLSFLQLFGHKSAHFLLFQVFPEGLVASDGRLQPGDQIIEINGADMTCATHAQVKIMGKWRNGKWKNGKSGLPNI